MPQGPGDDILDAIERGDSDELLTKKYKLNNGQIKAFKSLHYGLSNRRMRYDEIGNYYPELNQYFAKPAQAPQQPQAPVIEKPDFTKPVREPSVAESTAMTGANKVAAQKAETANQLQSLQEKFTNAHKPAVNLINKELNENDDVVNKLIYQNKYNAQKERDLTKLAAAPKTDMPIAAQLAAVRNRVLEPEVKSFDQPITPEEFKETKTIIQTDERQARQFLNQVTVRKPEKAKEIQSSIYLMDAMQRMQQKPDIGIKVNDNLAKLQSGELKYNAVTGQLVKEEGFFQSIVTGVKERSRQMADYDLYQQPDDQIIKLLEQRRANRDPDDPVPVPTGAGELGQMAGMEWSSLAKGAVVGALTSSVGAGAATPYITAAVNAPEYYKRSYSTALEETYDQLRNQGKTPEEALKLAQEQARYEGKLGAAEGAVSSFIGGRIGIKQLPKYNITGGFKNAVGNVLKQTAQYGADVTVDGLVDGMVAGYLQERMDVAAAEKGIKRDSEKNIKDAITGELMFSVALGAVTKAGQQLADPETYKKLLYHISRQPDETIDAKIGDMVIDGQLSEEDAKIAKAAIAEQKAVDKTVPDDIKDVSRMAMIDKIKERQELEQEIKFTDEALHPPKKEQIKKLNEEILEHSTHKKPQDETEAETQTEAEAGLLTEPGAVGEPEAVQGMEGQAAPTIEPLPEDVYISMYNDYRQYLDEDQRPLPFDEFKRKVDIDQLLEQPPSESVKERKIIDKDGKKYNVFLDNHGEGLYSVKVYDGNKKIGRLFLTKDKKSGSYYASGADVANEYQRKGIATQMYNSAEKEFGIKIVPSNAQSKDAKAFWGNRLKNQYAIQEQSAEGVYVPAPPTDSPQMGQGDEGQAPINETAAGQETSPEALKHYEVTAGSTPNQQTGRIPINPIVGAGPSKSKSQIIRDVSNALKQRIIYAKPGRRMAIGAYLPGFKGVKIRYNGDMDTTAHELGHSIDDHFNIYTAAANDPAILKELSKLAKHGGSDPPANHPDPKKYKLQEGFAEWLRGYVVNPDEATKQAPLTTALFNSKVNDKFKEAINQFSTDYRVWAGASGHDLITSNVEIKPPKEPNLLQQMFQKEETNSEFTINWVNRLAANYINPLNAFEKAAKYLRGIKGLDYVLPENDPVLLSRLLNGIDGKFGEVIKSGMIDARGNVLPSNTAVDVKDANGKVIKTQGIPVKNLNWLLEPLDNTDQVSIENDFKNVIAFMVAERTEELSKKYQRGDVLTGIGDGGITDFARAQKFLNEFYRGDPKEIARIEEAARRYREFADDILQYAVGKGRMSQEQYDQIKEDNNQYVALKRVLETEPGEEIVVYPRSGGKELGSKTELVHEIKGSTKPIQNPYSALLDMLYKTLRESDRNEVMVAFRDLMMPTRGMNQGDPQRIADVGIIGKKGDEETIPIFVDGKPEYWIFQKDIYKQLKAFDLDPFRVWYALQVPAKILRFTTTHFPTFALRNWVRDLQHRLILSNTGSGFKELVGNKEDWQAIARAGGLNSGYYWKNKDFYYGLLTEAMDLMTKDKKIIIADPIRLKNLWHRYEDLLYKGETSNRVAEYRAAFKKAKDEGMDDYNAMLYAGFRSRDLIDFAVAGHQMQKINQIIPFTNAAIQGLRSTYMSAKENPWGFLAKTMLYSVIPGAVAWAYNHYDEEDSKLYEELPGYQRDMFWNFRIGPNKWLSIPKPYELSLTSAGFDRAYSYVFAGNKNAFEGLGGEIRKTLLPFDEGNIAGPYQAIVEGLANFDFFRDRTIIPPDEDPLKLALRHTETASRLGKLLQKFSGWDARKWDNFIKRQFSYTGGFLLKLSDIGAESGRHEFDLTDTGLFKRSPAYNAVSVQRMIMFAKENDLTKTPPYKAFNQMVGRYFGADNDQEREQIGKEMIDYASELYARWKEMDIETYQEEKFEAKQEARK